MKSVPCRCLVVALLALGLQASSVDAAVVPKETPLAAKTFHHAALFPREVQQSLKDLPELAAGLAPELTELGAAPAESALYDTRTGRWSTLVLSVPLIPGTGDGNSLGWEEVAGEQPRDDGAMKDAVWGAVRGYLRQHAAQLRVDLAELASPRITIVEQGNLVFVWSQRTVGGVPVRDGGFTAVLNHGNLMLLGLQNWGEADPAGAASLSGEDARAVVSQHVSPHAVEEFKKGPRLELIPMSGEGRIELRLAWAVPVKMRNDLGSWEGLVDARSGELLAFEDRNLYASRKVVGGVFPVSNDGRPPDGQEQPGWPMPYANVVIGPNTLFTTTGGTFGCAVGSGQTTLSGRFLRITDTCGAVNETGAGDLDLGVSAGTDCTVPAGHSVGDTHSARSGFYELNRIVEQAKGYLPANAWLQGQLNSNMNLNQTCNAFWDGSSVNFFKDSGSACRNTGEIAAIFDHEWGHGMDNNGTNPNIAGPGEAVADIHAMMRLAASCTGRGFFKNQVCGGYGDACDGTTADGCTGVRDLDFMNHRCNQPHTISWALSGFTSAQCGGTGPAAACPAGGGTPCGRETHCEGYVAAETGWDLYARDLQAAPFNFDSNTALELAGRLSFLGTDAITNWYTCSVGGGCGATNGYMLYLAADDDDGTLANGTPHMSAIRAAFERHEIHCATPTVTNSGCAGGPTTAPTVTATALDSGVNLSWGAVTGAARYNVYRTEGVAACNFGKTKIGETTGTSFSDIGLLNGRPYSYMVLPVGSNTSCFGHASACQTATPAPGPNLGIRSAFTASLSGGDGDEFLDNCESATLQFTVENTGAGTLTNVRLLTVTPLTHPSTVVNTTLPAPIAASLSGCASADGTFNITAQGLAPNDTTQLQIEVTADEIFPATRSQIFSIANTESDWTDIPTRTFNFETDLSAWTINNGTWNRESPGANGTNFHLHSSTLLDNQCDLVRSPVVRLAANSTLSLFNRYTTETPVPIPYDRANVGVVDLGSSVRTTIVPSGGRLYELPPGTPNGACVTGGQAGWAGTQTSFAQSTWNAGALNPGGTFTNKRVQLEVAYGTDPGLAEEGFHFDEVTLTNFAVLGPDQQSDSCLAPGTLTGTVTDSVTTNPISGASVQAGTFSGTTNGSGVYSFDLPPATYSVTASAASHISSTVTGVVVTEAGTTTQDFALDPCPSITVSPSTIPAGTASVAYTQTFTQTGGIPPITWSLTGTLPTGISFNTSTGVLSGTPTQIGSFPITVTATDVNGCTGSRGYTLVINAAGAFVPTALVVDSSGNSVFEPGETVGVAPTWRNDTGAPQAVTGAASAFTGPGDPNPTYTITDGAANYGLVAAGASASCTSTSNCYALALGTPTSRPVLHWDASVLETLSSSETKSWKLHVGDSFTDVPRSSGFYRFIETLLHKGVTGGCGTTTYCPSTSTTREQLAVFVLEAKEGAGYTPPACAPPNTFTDVPETSPFCRFIEELASRGVVSGCGGGNYCPTNPVTREQMAIFVLRTLDPALNPPACAPPNLFADVPETSPFCKWIEELANRGVVSGCGSGNYCPGNPVTREQMSVFLGVTFSLTLYGS